jgi:hypothetical protein
MTYHMPTPKAQPGHMVNCIYAMFPGLKKPETGIPSMHMANASSTPTPEKPWNIGTSWNVQNTNLNGHSPLQMNWADWPKALEIG